MNLFYVSKPPVRYYCPYLLGKETLANQIINLSKVVGYTTSKCRDKTA